MSTNLDPLHHWH